VKFRVLGLVLVLAGGLAYLSRGAGAPPPSLAPEGPPRRAAEAWRAPAAAAEAPLPARDPFRFAAVAASPRAARVPPRVAAAPAAPAPPLPVRLIGFVRRGGSLKAALRVNGQVFVLGPGEQEAGYAVTTVDEEAGVSLLGPGGAELQLAPDSDK